MTKLFENRVAIVTGAGAGLGRSHALMLAEHGAKVVVNDLGGAVDGSGGSSGPAEAVVSEIEARGGQALADGASVTEPEQVEAMVAKAVDRFGRVDVLINNAGILRDKSFAKMTLADFRAVLDVHLWGSVVCTKAVWGLMREQEYGRVVLTTSSSGLYGNFGQANYGAAKTGMVGLMNVLALEGARSNVLVNTLSPTARTRMTEGLGIPEEALDAMTPQSVSAAALALCAEDAPNRTILCAGAGGYSETRIYETQGVSLPPEDQTPQGVLARMAEIRDPEGQREMPDGSAQTMHFLRMAAERQAPRGG